MQELDGKVAVVTGGASGIGRAVEKRMQRILRNENPVPPEEGPAILIH